MTAEGNAQNPAFGTTWAGVAPDGFQRFWEAILPRAANAAAANTSGTAYWLYLGFVDQVTVFQGISMQQTLQGAGTQVAELVFASTPIAPCRASQVLTKIGNADAALSSLTAAATSVVRPGAAMNATVQPYTHLWAGFRQAMGTTQAGFECVCDDMGQGALLVTAAAGALTGPGPWTGALVTSAITGMCPLMLGTVD